jgi:hypothetical protein
MKGRNFAKNIAGKPVVNAHRKITLHISAKEANAGASKEPGSCAAALAAIREIPNCTMARVHLGRAYIFNKTKEHWVRYKTTDALRSEIIAFDRGGKFEPGEYDLRPLSPSDLAGKGKNFVSSSTNRSNPKHVGKMPRKLHVVKGVRERAAKR